MSSKKTKTPLIKSNWEEDQSNLINTFFFSISLRKFGFITFKDIENLKDLLSGNIFTWALETSSMQMSLVFNSQISQINGFQREELVINQPVTQGEEYVHLITQIKHKGKCKNKVKIQLSMVLIKSSSPVTCHVKKSSSNTESDMGGMGFIFQSHRWIRVAVTSPFALVTQPASWIMKPACHSGQKVHPCHWTCFSVCDTACPHLSRTLWLLHLKGVTSSVHAPLQHVPV